jgi:hypothetical protein
VILEAIVRGSIAQIRLLNTEITRLVVLQYAGQDGGDLSECHSGA